MLSEQLVQETPQKVSQVSANTCTALLWTRRDLAQRLAFSTRTISRMIANGSLPPPIVLNRSPRWRPVDIEGWIAMGCPNDRSNRTSSIK